MVWFIVIVALVVVTLAFIEWRLWDKPQPNSLQDRGGGDPYRFRYSAKPFTGGHTYDSDYERHD